jgi:hypothetical protein
VSYYIAAVKHVGRRPPSLSRLRRNVLVLIAIGALAPSAGCERGRLETYNWTEDVKLANGTSIVISRKTTYRIVPQMLESHAAWFVEEDKVTIPASAWNENDIEFHVPIASPMNKILVLDRLEPEGTWIAIINSSCSYRRDNGRPFHGYFEFRYTERKWLLADDLSPESRGRSSNMEYRPRRGHVSQTEKESANRVNDPERIKKILSDRKDKSCA